MPASGWASSDLLTRFNEWAARPTSNDPITDAQKYRRLSDGQDQIILEVANLSGRILYSAPVLMTSADGGYVYTYGVDGNGYALFPLAGHIYPTLSAVPSYPWVPGVDYLDEGTQIRSLNNAPFPVAPYWYGISQPQQLSSSVNPVIQPPQARVLIVIRAVQDYAEEGGRNVELAAIMGARWAREWPVYATQIRKHLRGRRSLGPLTSEAAMSSGGGPAFGGMWP